MVLNKLRDGKAPVILAVNKVDNVQEKADLAAALTVPGKSDELPRYRADLC